MLRDEQDSYATCVSIFRCLNNTVCNFVLLLSCLTGLSAPRRPLALSGIAPASPTSPASSRTLPSATPSACTTAEMSILDRWLHERCIVHAPHFQCRNNRLTASLDVAVYKNSRNTNTCGNLVSFIIQRNYIQQAPQIGAVGRFNSEPTASFTRWRTNICLSGRYRSI